MGDRNFEPACLGLVCPFAVDPTDDFRHVCLKCGFERNIKKKEPPKKQDNSWLVILLLSPIIATSMYLLSEHNSQQLKASNPSSAQVIPSFR